MTYQGQTLQLIWPIRKLRRSVLNTICSELAYQEGRVQVFEELVEHSFVVARVLLSSVDAANDVISVQKE